MLQRRTSGLLPQQQSRHFKRIALLRVILSICIHSILLNLSAACLVDLDPV